MNKKLIGMITSALVIGAASTALANPFADVPADHWAYDAIDQLAADGVIEGYANGAFAGDKAITRYEMAQIVARAMANCDGADAADKATIDKLAAEFSTELDALGVRVEKLEKKVAGLKNFTMFGDTRVRYDYVSDQSDANLNQFRQRIRLGAKGDINEDFGFYLRYMVQNHTTWGQDNSINMMMDANVTWKNALPHTNLTVGRFSQDLGMSMYLLNSQGSNDGAKLTYKNKGWDVDLGYADFAQTSVGHGNPVTTKDAKGTVTRADVIDQAFYIDAKYKVNDDLKLQGMFFKTMDQEVKSQKAPGAETYSVAAEWQFAKNLYLMGEYVQNSELDGNEDDGSVIRLRYNTVSGAKPGSYSVFVERNDWNTRLMGDASISINNGECMGKAIGESNWQVGFDMALAKNIVWQNWYAWDRQDQDGKDLHDFARTQINFSF